MIRMIGQNIRALVSDFTDSGLGFATLEDDLSFNGRALPDITENFTFYWIQWDKTNNVGDTFHNTELRFIVQIE